jgi:DNA-directed RNA polymerase sigma subunit (sigma70/sigma32)
MENDGPDDPVSVYIREAGSVTPLAKDEEIELFRKLARPGDWDEARENVARRLIESHLTQVVSIAPKHSASSVAMLDLIQEGNIGLMNAVRSFAKSPIVTLPTTPTLALMTQSRRLSGCWRNIAP